MSSDLFTRWTRQGSASSSGVPECRTDRSNQTGDQAMAPPWRVDLLVHLIEQKAGSFATAEQAWAANFDQVRPKSVMSTM